MAARGVTTITRTTLRSLERAMDNDYIQLLTSLCDRRRVAWTGLGSDVFREVVSVGSRGGEPAATFANGEYAALQCASLVQFVVFQPIGESADDLVRITPHRGD